MSENWKKYTSQQQQQNIIIRDSEKEHVCQ